MDNTREVILGLPQGVRFTALFSVPPASFPLPYPLAPQLHSSSPDTLVTTPHVMQTQPSSWANLDGARVNTNHACVEGLVTVTDQWEPELLVGAQPFPHSFHVKGVQFMYFLAFLCSLPYSAPGNVERRIVQFGKNKGSALSPLGTRRPVGSAALPHSSRDRLSPAMERCPPQCSAASDCV